MRQPELTRLRRERYAIQRALRPIERSLATHWARLAEVEAAILELDPVLDLAMAPYRPVPIFARGELGGTLTATFLLATLAALGMEAMRLEDL